jgi:ABC-type transporter Mla MlaB component
MDMPRPPPQRNNIHVLIGGSIGPADVGPLWERVRAGLEDTDVVVVCDVAGLVDPDAVTVDALARLQLAARRFGRRVQLHHACGELKALLGLMGLADVLPCRDLPLEPSGKAEQREPSSGVEEERDSGDPVT